MILYSNEEFKKISSRSRFWLGHWFKRSNLTFYIVFAINNNVALLTKITILSEASL